MSKEQKLVFVGNEVHIRLDYEGGEEDSAPDEAQVRAAFVFWLIENKFQELISTYFEEFDNELSEAKKEIQKESPD